MIDIKRISKNTPMTILYIHGLDGSLTNEKRAVLENYGSVLAPSIDYRSNNNSIEYLVEKFKDKDIDIVMGSSMGGFAGFHVSNALQTPALLFNPALASRSVEQHEPELKNISMCFKQLVLGGKDDVVFAKDTLRFLSENFETLSNFTLHSRYNLAHRIPIEVFEEEVKLFFNQVNHI